MPKSATNTNYIRMLFHDRTVILFRPEINRMLKFPEATLIFSQAVYWWIQGGQSEFYKFKEPCGHDLYTSGDSWTEELGITVYGFDKGLKILVEKGLIRTRIDRRHHLPYYTVNPDAVNDFLNQVYSDSVNNLSTPSAQSPNHQGQKTLETPTEISDEKEESTDTADSNAKRDGQVSRNSTVRFRNNNTYTTKESPSDKSSKKKYKSTVVPSSFATRQDMNAYIAQLEFEDVEYVVDTIPDFVLERWGEQVAASPPQDVDASELSPQARQFVNQLGIKL